MSKLQCIITSYRRPKYLRPCLESMRAAGDNVELIVVDGGSDPETLAIIDELADRSIKLQDNPGADVLKNAGIELVTNDDFLCSSDDFVYPESWLPMLLDNWRRVNSGKAERQYVMMASPTELVIQRHTFPKGEGPTKRGQGYHYRPGPFGLKIMPTSVAMVAGTMMDTAATRRVGGFPVYGKTGQGDIAISRCFQAIRKEVGYFIDPVLIHLGQDKETDYPDYTRDFDADDDIFQAQARAHDGKIRGPLPDLAK